MLEKLLKKINNIERDISDVKRQVIDNIMDESVAITMTKREWKYIYNLGRGYMIYRCVPYGEKFGHIQYEPFRRFEQFILDNIKLTDGE